MKLFPALPHLALLISIDNILHTITELTFAKLSWITLLKLSHTKLIEYWEYLHIGKDITHLNVLHASLLGYLIK